MVINNWKMKYEGVGEISCTAPCSMYSVLYENKIIDDPFYGTNDRSNCCSYEAHLQYGQK